MIYYKLLDIQNLDVIIEKCLLYAKTIDSAYNRRLSSWYDINALELINACPELAVGLQKYDLTVRMAALYVMYHPSHTKIHIDKYPSQARINIPLLNCTNTYTNFYESNDGMTPWTNPKSGITSYSPVGECKLVDRVELKQATIIRTKVFHAVNLPKDNPVPRITLTLGLDKDPVFMLE
jgi:hypothetical protein